MNAGTKPATAGLEILIVEDSPTQAVQLERILVQQGYRVTHAANGRQAIDLARQRVPALIISDVVMPEMDGYAFCHAVRADARLQQIPLILVTSLSGAADVIRGLECGADNFIRKPYEEKYLLARVNYALTNRTLRAKESLQMGVHISLGGQRHFITAERQQILDLLISTYEEAIHLNDALKVREEQVARANRTLAGLYRIAKVLNQATTQQEVLDQVLEKAMELPGVQAGWISLREGSTEFRLGAARGLPPALEAPGAMEGDCLCRRQLLSGELTQVTNVLTCERLQRASGDTRGLRYHASVPLGTGDRMIGVLNLAGAEDGLFRDEELQILNGVGNQIALALERAAAKARADEYARRLAERLNVAEVKYQALMHYANDAIFVIDPAGDVLEVNRQAEVMLGLPSARIVGRQYTDLVSTASRDDVIELFLHVLNIGATRAYDLHLPYADGRQICADFSASLVPTDGTSVVLAIGRDVTEQNHLERQIQQAQKMEAIGQLAGGVAHDFNNLLTAILGYSDMVLEGLDASDPRRQDVEEIRRAGQSASSLTKQLLAFSRKQLLEPVVLDLNALVSNVERMIGRLIGEEIRVVMELDPALGHIKADPGQLEQVIVNLAVNGRDAMPGGGTLTIATANASFEGSHPVTRMGTKPGRYVTLEVRDTGQGMDEHTQSHIFEPFFTTKGKSEGTGLGLATVYGIVKQSQGSIYVDSTPERGTTFSLYFPRVEGEPADLDKPREPAQRRQGTETILLVEDHVVLRALARKMLSKQGYTVLEAQHGEEALAIAARHEGTIDLLLTDIVMPGMTGRTLADRLTERYAGIKVLFTSGYSDDALDRRGILPAGTAFVGKPYVARQLLQKVREVLDMQE